MLAHQCEISHRERGIGPEEGNGKGKVRAAPVLSASNDGCGESRRVETEERGTRSIPRRGRR